MSRVVVRKVAGGKLLRLRVERGGGSEGRVRLTGDFFVHPEEGIVELEAALSLLSPEMSEAEMAAALDERLERQGIEVVGFAPADLAAMMAEARR